MKWRSAFPTIRAIGPRLRRQQVYTGDGVTTAFNLPADFKRMLLTANVWASSDTGAPMRFIGDPDEWLQRRAANFFSGPGEWTMMGGQMLIEPPIPVGATARFAYLERNCIALASGGFGDRFQSDADSFVLDARLLKARHDLAVEGAQGLALCRGHGDLWRCTG